MSDAASNRYDDVMLRTGQWFLIGLVIIFSIHTRRWVAWQVEIPTVFIGFRAALLFLFDFPLVLLLVIFVARLASNPYYGESVSDALNDIVTLRYGGVWWLLLTIWIGLSAFWAKVPQLAYYGAFQTILLFGTAILVAQTVRQGDDEPVLWLFCIGAVVQSLIAIAQLVHGDAIGLGALGELQWQPDDLFGYGETIFRGYGLTPHPNILAGYIVVSLFAAITLIVRYGFYTLRGALAVVVFVILCGGLLVTLSRTGLLAALVPLLVVVILKRSELRRIVSVQTLPIIGLTMVVLIAGIFLFGDTLIERNFGLQDLSGVENRLTLGYSDTWDVAQENLVVGVGEYNLMVAVGRNVLAPTVPTLLPAHNAFFVILADLGIVGVILFALACITILSTLLRNPQGPLLIWTLAFVAWFVILLLDYYPWADYRGRLLMLWLVGMWWGYRMRVEQELTASSLRSRT